MRRSGFDCLGVPLKRGLHVAIYNDLLLAGGLSYDHVLAGGWNLKVWNEVRISNEFYKMSIFVDV